MKYEWLDNTPDLLKHLGERFPNKLPTKLTTETGLAELIGQQKVIAYIAGCLKQQEQQGE